MRQAKNTKNAMHGHFPFRAAGPGYRCHTHGDKGYRKPAANFGFTIIEMLIVVAVISILAGMLMPAVNLVRNQARESAVRSEIAGLDVAMTAYFQDRAEYPTDQYWKEIGDEPSAPRQSGQALVKGLDEDGYFDFDPTRLRDEEIDDDGGDDYVFINRLDYETYYRFRNNYDRDAPDWEGYDGEDWAVAVNQWDVSHVNRNSVDIWTSDRFGADFVDWWLDAEAEFTSAYEVTLDSGPTISVPTWETLRGEERRFQEIYKTISNW